MHVLVRTDYGVYLHGMVCVFVQNEELYVSIISERYHDVLLFHAQGGVNVGDVDAKACASSCVLSVSVLRQESRPLRARRSPITLSELIGVSTRLVSAFGVAHVFY